MEKRFLAPSLLILALMSCLFLTRDARTAPRYPQVPAHVSDPYVQVTSVTVEPSTIHKTQNPNTATVIVQILLRGQAPPNPEAIVEVGTYSSDPANNNVKYEKPTRTISLQNGVTVVKVKTEATGETTQGKPRIIAQITGATKGINIKDSESPKDSIAELAVLDP
jgi:hypothetical protein